MAGEKQRGVSEDPLAISIEENQLHVPDLKELCRFLQMDSARVDLLTMRRDAELPAPLDRFTITAKNERGRLGLSTTAVLDPGTPRYVGVALYKHLFTEDVPAQDDLLHPLSHGYERKQKPRPATGSAVFKAPISELKVAISTYPNWQQIKRVEITNKLSRTPRDQDTRSNRHGRVIIKPRCIDRNMDTEKYVEDFLTVSLITLSALVGYVDRTRRLPLLTTARTPDIAEVTSQLAATSQKPATNKPKPKQKESVRKRNPEKQFEGIPDTEQITAKDELPRLDDIGGYEDIKETIREVVLAFRRPDIAVLWGDPAPRRLLLYGPPGTGKTTFARSVASELGAKLRMVKSTDINDMYVSNSAKNIEKLFTELRAIDEPTVVVMDEIEKIVNTKGGSERVEVAGVFQREMETITQKNEHIVFVATMNDKDGIDPALIRSDRFDSHIYIGLPDDDARKHIWRSTIAGLLSKSTESFRPFGSMEMSEIHATIEELARKSEGCTGADIKIAFKELRSKKMKEHVKNGAFEPIDAKQLLAALDSFRQQ